MNGMILPGTPIAIDYWKQCHTQTVRLFFLSHLHADHIQGLSSTWRYPIYTSETNAALLNLKFKFAKGVVKILEVGETYQFPLDEEEEYILSVTVLDANHVPGSIMFLFQGYFGNYLYCADMRWYPELLENPVLKQVVELRALDFIFMDNTFSAPYCDFPSREEAKKEIFHIIDDNPDSVIKIGVRSLGKEALLEAVALRYQERILVSQEKYQMLRVLKAPDVYTTDPKQARIHAVLINHITTKAQEKWNEETSTISILLTALYVGWPYGPYSASAPRGIFVVPYSDHSSFAELLDMVSALAPREVISIITKVSTKGWWSEPNAPDQAIKSNMSLYDHLLTTPKPDFIMIPKSIEKVMKPGSRILHHPEIRHCALRNGLMPMPRRARSYPRGWFIRSPKPTTHSPAPTGTMSIDVSVPSISSTPTHTSQPWKPNETCSSSNKVCEKLLLQPSFRACNVSTTTQTLPCKLCKHKEFTTSPSRKDCATQTSYKRKRESENNSRDEVKEMIDPELRKLQHESIVATRILISEVAAECLKEDNLKMLLTKSKSLCQVLRLAKPLYQDI